MQPSAPGHHGSLMSRSHTVNKKYFCQIFLRPEYIFDAISAKFKDHFIIDLSIHISTCIESQWWEARCLRGCSWWEVDIVGHGVCWAELGARVSAVRRPGPGPNTAPCHGRTIHHNLGCRSADLSLLYSPALYRLELYSDYNVSSFSYLYSYYFLCFRLIYFFFQIVWKWIEQFKLCLL